MTIPRSYQALFSISALLGCLFIIVTIVGTVNRLENHSKPTHHKNTKGQRRKNASFTTSGDSKTSFPIAINSAILHTSARSLGLDFEDTATCLNYTYVAVDASMIFLDLSNGAYRLKLEFSPCGDLMDPKSLAVGKSAVLARSLSIFFDNRVFNFTAGLPMAVQDYANSFDSGDINNYPFDKYRASNIYMEGHFLTPLPSSTAKPQSDSVSLLLSFDAGLLTYSINVESIRDITPPPSPSTGHVIDLDFSVSRSGTTIFFSLLVMAIMWMLSILAFCLAVTVWITGRKVEPPTIAFSASLMFTIPGIRHIQPGSPPIGCTADTVSFFWAMVLCAITASLLVINYIIKYNMEALSALFPDIEKKPAEPEKPPPKKEKEEASAVVVQVHETRPLDAVDEKKK
ncbi:hypothetical protein HDU97_002807, partial [Phlyctochytrium planicorne]